MSLVGIGKATKVLGVSRNHLYQLANDGKIPHFKIGNALRFDLDELLKLCKRA